MSFLHNCRTLCCLISCDFQHHNKPCEVQSGNLGPERTGGTQEIRFSGRNGFPTVKEPQGNFKL